jgi:hypothetical protein
MTFSLASDVDFAIPGNLFRDAASNVSSCSTWQRTTDPPVRRASVLAGKPVGHFFVFVALLRTAIDHFDLG